MASPASPPWPGICRYADGDVDDGVGPYTGAAVYIGCSLALLADADAAVDAPGRESMTDGEEASGACTLCE